MSGTLLLVLLLVVMVGAAHSHLVVLRDTGTRVRREVGPVMKTQKRYRRLQHSIMVQADIRSRSGILSFQHSDPFL